MGEMTRALGVLDSIKGMHLIQFPSGAWGYVGVVPAALRYRRKDGAPLTDKDIENAAIVGPRLAGLVTATWETREEALCAARGIA